ncbi:MAG: hypothetical protein II551_07345, partial [Paludibacteraceae bacterium]|nr:hypothetical protein [Paludibacteraceae bacterium]
WKMENGKWKMRNRAERFRRRKSINFEAWKKLFQKKTEKICIYAIFVVSLHANLGLTICY